MGKGRKYLLLGLLIKSVMIQGDNSLEGKIYEIKDNHKYEKTEYSDTTNLKSYYPFYNKCKED